MLKITLLPFILSVGLLTHIQFAQAQITIIGPSVHTLYPENVMVARDAGDCSKWYWLPANWNALSNPRDSRVSLQFEKAPKGLLPRAIYSITYEANSFPDQMDSAVNKLADYAKRKAEQEKFILSDNALGSTENYSACEKILPRLEPLPLQENQKTENIRNKAFTVESKFIASNTGQQRILVNAVSNPLVDGGDFSRSLTDSASGALPLPAAAQTPALFLESYGEASLEKQTVSKFREYTEMVTSCHEECKRYLYFIKKCRTVCEHHPETQVTLEKMQSESMMGIRVVTPDGAPFSLTSEIQEELLNRLITRAFGKMDPTGDGLTRLRPLNFSQPNPLTKIENAGSYRVRVENWNVGKQGFSGLASVGNGLAEDAKAPLESFLNSAAFQCAVKEGKPYLSPKCQRLSPNFKAGN